MVVKMSIDNFLYHTMLSMLYVCCVLYRKSNMKYLGMTVSYTLFLVKPCTLEIIISALTGSEGKVKLSQLLTLLPFLISPPAPLFSSKQLSSRFLGFFFYFLPQEFLLCVLLSQTIPILLLSL